MELEFNGPKEEVKELQAMHLCGTADLELPSLSDFSNDRTTGFAYIAQNRIWTGKSELLVKFLNGIPRGWTYEGSRINKSTILNWANTWHDMSLSKGVFVPKFVQARWCDTADIRISLNSQKNETSIGIEAQDIPHTEPTMCLDLSYDNDVYIKHLVIHEFGHALGLLHEHQRSDFWKILKPYIEEEKIIQKFSLDMFNKNWTTVSANRFSQTVTSEYDPYSIMHYWFDKDWLKAKYSNTTLVEAEYNEHKLTEEQKMYLLGVHERYNLAKEPSDMDIEFLAKMYKSTKSTTGDTRSANVVTCSNCTSGCVVL